MNKTGFFSIVLLAGFIMCFCCAKIGNAQPKASPEMRIHKHVEKLKTQLSLSDDQATKIEAILLDKEKQIAQLGQDSTSDPKAFKKQKRAINKNAMDQVNMVLSEQQRQKWQAVKAQKQGAKTRKSDQ